MHRRTASRIASSALTLLCLAAAAPVANAQRAPAPAAPPTRPPGLAPTDPWDTFSADMTLQRSRVDANGRRVGGEPIAQRYHWERSSVTGHWKTTLTLAPAAPVSLRTVHGAAAVDDRLLVARIEDAEDGTGPKIYDKDGRLLPTPSVIDQLLPALAARDAAIAPRLPAAATPGQRSRTTPAHARLADNQVIKRSGKDARRLALQRQHGSPVGQVRGLDRYVKARADRTEETLVDTQLQLPVETNVVREGRLVSQRTVSYAPAGADLIVRHRVHTERLLSPQSGERAVVDIEFSNVRLEQRR